MAENSKIGWTDHTVNFWIGCSPVSPACDKCYAETLMDKRYKRVQWGPRSERVRTSADNWRKPYRWNKTRHPSGRRWRVFTLSLGDFFDNQAPAEWRREAWQIIRDTQNLEWLILTKRPSNIGKMLPMDWEEGYLNVRFGVTCENQEETDRRLPALLRVRQQLLPFVSAEPLLSPIDFREYLQYLGWIITGCESGPGARYTPDYCFAEIRDQCQEYSVPFFLKQAMRDGRLRLEPELDGRQWIQFPGDDQQGGIAA